VTVSLLVVEQCPHCTAARHSGRTRFAKIDRKLKSASLAIHTSCFLLLTVTFLLLRVVSVDIIHGGQVTVGLQCDVCAIGAVQVAQMWNLRLL
jgi:hypothetical protein